MGGLLWLASSRRTLHSAVPRSMFDEEHDPLTATADGVRAGKAKPFLLRISLPRFFGILAAMTIVIGVILLAVYLTRKRDARTATLAGDLARLRDAALNDTSMFARLGVFLDTFGNRISGSANLENAIDWIAQQMQAVDGLAGVAKEPANVTHWVRNQEFALLVEPAALAKSMFVLGLGNSIGTPAGGINGTVIVVSSFDEMNARAAEIPGKIVCFNVPFTSYGATVAYRVFGAVNAAPLGAIAVLVRSVTPFSLQTPHTGTSQRSTIPAMAITVEDAELFARLAAAGVSIRVSMYMGAQLLPNSLSHNVLGQVTGATLYVAPPAEPPSESKRQLTCLVD